MCLNFPSLWEDDHEKEGKKKGGTSGVMSLHCTVKEEGADAKDGGVLPFLPANFILTVPRALKEEAQDTCPKALAASSECSTFSGNVEDPGEGAWKPGLEGAGASSSAPNLRLHHSLHQKNRKRKLQVPEPEKGLEELQSLVDSQAGNPNTATEKDVSKEAGQPTRMDFPQEPCPIEGRMMVWFKFQNHPFWPAMVQSVSQAEQTARVLLI